jgi:hypothetical protein
MYPSAPIKVGLDFAQYNIDCNKFSILNGENEHIARARKSLERIDGGMYLLFSLLSLCDPNRRSSPLDVQCDELDFYEAIKKQRGNANLLTRISFIPTCL